MNLDYNKKNLVFTIDTSVSGTTGILVRAVNQIRKILQKQNINNLDEINIFLKFKGFNNHFKKCTVDKSLKEIEIFNNKSFQDLFIDIPIQHSIVNMDCDNDKNNNKLLSCENNYKIAKKLNWNNDIINKINHYKNIFIDDNTLGIHLRFTSMTLHNKAYGNVSLKDYIDKIKMYIEKYNIINLFIASDNHESIQKIKDEIPNIKINYFDNFSKQTHEVQKNHNSMDFEIYNRVNNKESYTEVILDSIMLSKCKYLIHRVSSVSLLAILLGNNIKSECLNNNNKFI